MYAFSGDPITYGHIDIIERASKVFDKVMVGIGANPKKQYTFSLEERTEMAKKSLKRFSNVEVVSYSGLTAYYAYENGINVIVKGVRNSADFDYEDMQDEVHKSQKLGGIDTHILFARPELAHISSSTVKGIQIEQGLIHEYVPLYVKQCLEARLSGQYIVGITGEIGSGKSYVSRKFCDIGKTKGISVHNVELDRVGHQILGELKEPIYEEIRRQIIDTFGEKIRKPDGMIDRKALGEIVFNDNNSLDKLNAIMSTPMLVRLRRELYDKKGLILVDAALIAESNISYLCNNNVVLVNVDKQTQETRLKTRNLTHEQIQRRLMGQFPFKDKKEKLEKAIQRDNQGKIWTIDNSENSDKKIKNVFENIVSELNVK